MKKMIGVLNLFISIIDEVVGWKMIRLEALHPPKNKMLLAAVLGTGI